MKKGILFLFLLVFLSGCNNKNMHKESAAESLSLEPYIESQEAATDFLEKVTLRKESILTRCMVFRDQVTYLNPAHVNGNLLGIEIDSELYQTDDAEKDIQEKWEKDRNSLEQMDSVQDIQHTEMLYGKGYWLMEASYNLQIENALCPCVVFYKADQVTEGYVLLTRISLDNSKTSEDSADILSAVLDSYGIRTDSAPAD